jgi:hypothetical protein
MGSGVLFFRWIQQQRFDQLKPTVASPIQDKRRRMSGHLTKPWMLLAKAAILSDSRENTGSQNLIRSGGSFCYATVMGERTYRHSVPLSDPVSGLRLYKQTTIPPPPSFSITR